MKVNDPFSDEKMPGMPSVESSLDRDGATTKIYGERATIFEPGQSGRHILYIKSGWAMTYKILPSGTRIVTDFLLRGDMISTTAADLAQETISTVTDVVIGELPDILADATLSASARHVRIVMTELLRRQARMSEHLANVGGRDGLERMAHLLLELAFRARQTRKLNQDALVCPLRQADIGDAVGLSTVHANRVLKDMRMNNLAYFRNGIVEFPDRQRLMELVNFHPGYLSLDYLD